MEYVEFFGFIVYGFGFCFVFFAYFELHHPSDLDLGLFFKPVWQQKALGMFLSTFCVVAAPIALLWYQCHLSVILSPGVSCFCLCAVF